MSNNKENSKENSDFFETVELVKDGVDVSLETDLLDLEYDLAGMRVSMDNINTLSIKRDNIPLGVSVSYEDETVAPMITFEFSDENENKIDERSIVDAALEEYEKSIKKRKDRA